MMRFRTLAAAAAFSAALAPHVTAAAPAPPPGIERVVRLEIDAPGLPTPLASALPVLVEAALESSALLEVIPPPPRDPAWSAARTPAGWRLQLGVTGKGPWKVTVRATPTGEAPQLKTASRLAGMKLSFQDRDRMAAAVDEMAAGLQEQWQAAGVLPAGTAPSAPPRALDAQPEAIDGYVAAMSALRAGSAGEAARRMETLQGSHPGFALAAAQKALFDLAQGAPAGACPAEAAADAASPLARSVCTALGHLAAERPDLALQSAEKLKLQSPALVWAHALAGLSLAARGESRLAVDAWRLASQTDPSDARLRMWLGRALMAAGDFKGAAASLAEARAAWPELWRAYALEAECRARERDTKAAAGVLQQMRREMDARGVVPATDDQSPELMMGSLQLMEGHFQGALEIFTTAADRLTQAQAPLAATRTLLETIVEMKRDLANSRDPVTRDRQLAEVEAALARLEGMIPPEEREGKPWPMLRLRGLLQVKRGDTAEAWRTVERLRSFADRPGYTGYEEAYLSAAIMLKEGDHEGALTQFQRVVDTRGTMVDVMDLAQFQSRLQRNDDARRNFQIFDDRLTAWDPRAQPPGEMVLTDPHLSLLVPLYHLARAQFGVRNGDAQDSRKHYSRMLNYFRSPDEQFEPYVREAYDRGARPE